MGRAGGGGRREGGGRGGREGRGKGKGWGGGGGGGGGGGRGGIRGRGRNGDRGKGDINACSYCLCLLSCVGLCKVRSESNLCDWTRVLAPTL